VNRKKFYLFLCVLGAVLPYSQFVPWLLENGLNASFFVHQLFANHISAFFAWDVLISAVVVVGFVRTESKRSSLHLAWLPILGVLTVGVSFGLPLFLYLRERTLEGTGMAPARV
jgi:Terpene cyclase DEP1